MRTRQVGKKGITFAAAILVIFVVIFVGALAYIASPTDGPADSKKAYFEDLNFKLDPHKLWHVGVPVSTEGNLNLSLTSDNSVRVYARLEDGGTFLLDKVTSGYQQFVIHVVPSMRTIEVAVVNLEDAPVTVSGLTCVLSQ
jgi:hypothetical protein